MAGGVDGQARSYCIATADFATAQGWTTPMRLAEGWLLELLEWRLDPVGEGTSRLAVSGSPGSARPGVLAPGSTCQTSPAGLLRFGSEPLSETSSPQTCPALEIPLSR